MWLKLKICRVISFYNNDQKCSVSPCSAAVSLTSGQKKTLLYESKRKGTEKVWMRQSIRNITFSLQGVRHCARYQRGSLIWVHLWHTFNFFDRVWKGKDVAGWLFASIRGEKNLPSKCSSALVSNVRTLIWVISYLSWIGTVHTR